MFQQISQQADIKRASDISAEVEKLAKDGDPVAAWYIGCSFSNRIATCAQGKRVTSKQGKSVTLPEQDFGGMPKDFLKKSVGETDEIALKYFEIAAKGDLREGMLSLANKIFTTKSLEIDQRIGCFWMAKAHDKGCKDAMQILENEMMLVRDINASLLTMEDQPPHMKRMIQEHGMVLGGPNLGSFLLATRIREISAWGGNSFKGTGYPVYGYSFIKKLQTLQNTFPIQVCTHFELRSLSLYPLDFCG